MDRHAHRFALVALVVLAGCSGGGGAKQGDPVARVGKTTITLEDLQKKLDEQSPFVRVRYADPQKKREFLDAQVRFEVLAAEARARGYDKDPEVEEAVKKIIVQRLTREEFDSRVKLTDISDADLQAYYDAHKADFQKPEMVRVSVLVLAFGADDQSKAEAKKKADELHKQASDKAKLEDRAFFRDLVEKNTTDAATRPAGGDLRYVSSAELEQRFGRAASDWAFASDLNNEVSPVVEGNDAWLIFKRTGRRKEISRTLDQVRNQIKNVVYRDKRTAAFDAYVEELKKKAGVEVFPEKLEKIHVEATLPPMEEDDHDHGPPMPIPGMPSDEPADEPEPAPAPNPKAPSPAPSMGASSGAKG